ncbi:MAG: 8-amino-7-oxononanoate synthase [Pseudomonadota bacterium]|nr:8-amino-7-oxononanoate synthase [Pseudomonadota bacterium]
MRTDLFQRVADRRAQRVAQQRGRVRHAVTRREGVRHEVEGRWLVGFCSNDYLGLSQQRSAIAVLQDAASRHGLGSTGSHLVSGHHAAHEALECEVADWLGYPRGLLFGSGFMANLAVLQSLLEAGDVCVQDRLNHASLIDAAHLSGCHLRRYPHADAEGALRQLSAVPDVAAILATDGVFSMDGDVAPLQPLMQAARMQHALLYVDDAHGVGVLGEHGRGSVAAAGLDARDVPLQLVTLGKALGGYGAVVVGDQHLIAHMAEVARPYLYTTALPPALAAASLVTVRTARRDDAARDTLFGLIAHFKRVAEVHGLELLPSATPIQPLLCGSEARANAFAEGLRAAGYWVAPIRPPTVPEGRSRLRITLSALHTTTEIDGLLEVVAGMRDALAARRDAPP